MANRDQLVTDLKGDSHGAFQSTIRYSALQNEEKLTNPYTLLVSSLGFETSEVLHLGHSFVWC